MTPHVRRILRLTLAVVALVSAFAVAPSASSASVRTYGATTLQLDPGTAAALKSLGVAPGVVAPATAGPAGIAFPITNPLVSALFTRNISHSGGLTLTAESTVVSLTDYWINLGSRTLSANVSVAGGPNLGRVAILNLDFSGARIRFWPALSIGPVRATLTGAAASTLNSVFHTNALTSQTVLGTATVRYSSFGF
jgi:hypothetical protein